MAHPTFGGFFRSPKGLRYDKRDHLRPFRTASWANHDFFGSPDPGAMSGLDQARPDTGGRGGLDRSGLAVRPRDCTMGTGRPDLVSAFIMVHLDVPSAGPPACGP
jgi:hypothetical protein